MPFYFKRSGMAIGAFHGRSGPLIDNIGVYFFLDVPVKVHILSLDFRSASALLSVGRPSAVRSTRLVNNSGIQQRISRKVSYITTAETSTTIA